MGTNAEFFNGQPLCHSLLRCQVSHALGSSLLQSANPLGYGENLSLFQDALPERIGDGAVSSSLQPFPAMVPGSSSSLRMTS